jgi:hypothetical protein
MSTVTRKRFRRIFAACEAAGRCGSKRHFPISDESLKSLFGTRLQALVLVESCPSKPLTFACLAIWRAVNLPYTVSCVRVCFTLCDSARLTERSCL